MKAPALMCDSLLNSMKDDIRPGKGKRQTYKYSDISDDSFNNQRLAVGTEFFKGVELTDSIYLILH